MNIAIIDADLISRPKQRFPNLACMKMSGYFKSIKDNVVLKTNFDNLEAFDRVYMSKVFTDTEVPEHILTLPNVEYGGTGFFYDKAPQLPFFIEHHKPDYDLYKDWVEDNVKNGAARKDFAYYTDYSIGFMTRGCVRQCSFCVNKNYKTCEIHSSVYEFLDNNRPRICLLDDNVLSCSQWRLVFSQLQETNKQFQFKQGLDERLLTDEKCEIIFKQSKWIGDYIFAFDNVNDSDIIIEKLKLIRQHTNSYIKFYLFCGFNHDNPDHYDEQFWINDIVDTFRRIEILMEYQCLPYIMRYKDYELSPHRGIYVNLARWCNQPSFFKKQSFREFIFVTDGKGRGDNLYASKKYMIDFERVYPEIAKKYFDLKFEDFKPKT